MKFRLVIIAALGFALALYLVMYVGLGAVLSAAVAVGWGGFAILCLYGFGLFFLLGAAWHVLLPRLAISALKGFGLARMGRDAAAEVVPRFQLRRLLLRA